MFNFEKLEVWKKNSAFAGNVYELTKRFPADERFGLTNQMRRAAVSVSPHIAEGCSRSSKTDFRRFVGIARGIGVRTHLAHIAREQSLLPAGDHDKLNQSTLEIVRMLSGLRDSLRD